MSAPAPVQGDNTRPATSRTDQVQDNPAGCQSDPGSRPARERSYIINVGPFSYSPGTTDTLDRQPALVLDGDALDPIGGAVRSSATGGSRPRARTSTGRYSRCAEPCVRRFSRTRNLARMSTRDELWRCLDYLRPGGSLVVPSMYRLGRSLQDLISIVAGLRKRGTGFPVPTRSARHHHTGRVPGLPRLRRTRRVHPRTHRRRHQRGLGRCSRPQAAPRSPTSYVPGADRARSRHAYPPRCHGVIDRTRSRRAPRSTNTCPSSALDRRASKPNPPS